MVNTNTRILPIKWAASNLYRYRNAAAKANEHPSYQSNACASYRT